MRRSATLVWVILLALAAGACQTDSGRRSPGDKGFPPDIGQALNFDLGSKRFDHFSIMNTSDLGEPVKNVTLKLYRADNTVWDTKVYGQLAMGEKKCFVYDLPNDANIVRAEITATWNDGMTTQVLTSTVQVSVPFWLYCAEFWFGKNAEGMMEVESAGALHQLRIPGS